jgi:hypothetical protein
MCSRLFDDTPLPGLLADMAAVVPHARMPRICAGDASGRRGYAAAAAAAGAGGAPRPGVKDAAAVVPPNESGQRR